MYTCLACEKSDRIEDRDRPVSGQKKRGNPVTQDSLKVLLGVERNQNKTPFDEDNIPKWKRCQYESAIKSNFS